MKQREHSVSPNNLFHRKIHVPGCFLSAAFWLAAGSGFAQVPVTVGPARAVPPAMIGANVVMDRDQFAGSSVHPWSDPQDLGDLVETGMSMIRYPGGTHGNYFNWLEGRYYSDSISTYNYPPEDTKTATDALDGRVMWMLNVITESMADVTNALSKACDRGAEVKYIELGNEFYFNAYDPTSTSYDTIYFFNGVSNGWVNGTAYGTNMNTWAAALRSRFPDATIALPLDRGIVNSTTTRRALWNAQVDAACTNYDAITLHVYTESLIDLGYGTTTVAAEQTAQWNNFTNGTGAVQLLLGSTRQGWTDMINHQNFWIPTGKPVWFTEFGVEPATMPHVVKGTWADGLANFTLYHTLLSFPQAEIAQEHQYIDLHHGGSSEFSNVKINVGQSLSGTLGTLTAEGHVHRAMASVARDKEALSILGFTGAITNAPAGITPYSTLIGLMFSDATNSSAILANLSSQTQTVSTAGLGPAGADVTILTADKFYRFVVQTNDVTYSQSVMGSTLALPPYSLCTISNLNQSAAPENFEYTPKFSGTRIPVYVSDDAASVRPVLWDAADQNSGELLSYSLVGTKNPGWASASGTNGLSFAPATLGISTQVHVRVADSSGKSDYATFDVTVIDGSIDSDGDGLVNNGEIQKGSDPYRTDTDGDGVSDLKDQFPRDPTRQFALAMSSPERFNVLADSFANQSNPSQITGTFLALQLNKAGASTNSKVAYLKFDATALVTNRGIAQVTLNLFSETEKDTVHVLAVGDTSWSESTLCWDNRPATGALITSFQAVSNSWLTADITDYVISNRLFSIAADEQGGSFGKFSSRETASNAPFLEIRTFVNRAPQFLNTNFSANAAVAGTAYHASINTSAEDQDGDAISYSKVDGALWLHIAPDGTLSGTPAAYHAGTNDFTVQVSDGELTDTAVLRIIVGTAGSDSVTSAVVADTYVRERSQDQSSNFGTDVILSLRQLDASNQGRLTYLKFTVTNITAQVTNVLLKVYATTETNAINVHALSDSSWGETTLTFANRPTEGALLTNSPAAAAPAWRTFNITGYITSNGTYSLVLDERGDTVGELASREAGAATAPYLVIDQAGGAPAGYALWVQQNGLSGANVEPDTDADGDQHVNLVEYALNGNPTNSASPAVLPTAVLRQTGGTNWIEYVYLQRIGVSDLVYQIQSTTNLVSGPWTNAPVTLLGSGAVNGSFNAVSNRLNAVQNAEFIRLRIGLQ